MSYNILLCGVGGQGTVLASKLLAAGAAKDNKAVHSAETIGMAQRGGPVTSHVRIGDDVYSPLIPKGCADLIIAFEPSEAARNIDYLKKDGAVIVNEVTINPVTQALSGEKYDGQEMLDFLSKKTSNLKVVNSNTLCEKFGSAKFFNVAVLGVALGAGYLDISKDAMIQAIECTVKKDFVNTNKEVFNHGIASV